eukprot:gene4713-8297_t
MKFNVFLVLLIQLSLYSSALAIYKKCVCTQEINPVCGSNGVTYQNACLAACAGVTVVSQGVCPTGTSGNGMTTQNCQCTCTTATGTSGNGCSSKFHPVCGADGITYLNACVATANGVTIVSQGACPMTTSGNGNGKYW